MVSFMIESLFKSHVFNFQRSVIEEQMNIHILTHFSNPIFLFKVAELLPHINTLDIKETKASTLECKENDQKLRISHVKNVNKSKNRLTPVKLETKNNIKKLSSGGRDKGRKFPSIPRI